MSEVVNLNRARKARDRAAAQATAVGNRAAFGRTKAEKAATLAEKAKTHTTLDGHKREP